MSYHAATDSQPNPFVDPSPYNLQPDDPPRRKIAIIGFDTNLTDNAPFDDPAWEIWGLNMGNRIGTHKDSQGRWRADRWFDLHELHAQNDKDMAWIQACPCPIYLTHDFGSNPHRRVYPLVEVEAFLRTRFGMLSPYWASSFAYMVALAIYEQAEAIGLFGISLSWGRERIYERGNLEFYLGLALGLGIDLALPTGTPLLRHPARYGFEYDAERDAVIADAVETQRQLMQAEDMKGAFDEIVDARLNSMRIMRDSMWSMLRAFSHAKPSEIRRAIEAQEAYLKAMEDV